MGKNWLKAFEMWGDALVDTHIQIWARILWTEIVVNEEVVNEIKEKRQEIYPIQKTMRHILGHENLLRTTIKRDFIRNHDAIDEGYE